MAICYCHQCKKVLAKAKNRAEACQLAVLHMGLTPHIMVFGYTNANAKKQGLI